MEGIHCDNCPNGQKKTEKEMANTSCDGIYNKIDCFQEFLYDKKLIYVPNGSTRLAINEEIYNILRHYSTKKEDKTTEDLKIIKPCEIMEEILKKIYGNRKTKKKVM